MTIVDTHRHTCVALFTLLKPNRKTMPVSYLLAPISIGDNIRKKRMELKLLQKDVARILGVTEDSITNWEKNRRIKA